MIRPVFSGTPIDVGVPLISDQPEFNVYPMPASSYLNIEVAAELQDRMHTAVFNSSGQLVYDNPDFQKAIDVSALPRGLYLIRITNQVTGGAASRLITITD